MFRETKSIWLLQYAMEKHPNILLDEAYSAVLRHLKKIRLNIEIVSNQATVS